METNDLETLDLTLTPWLVVARKELGVKERQGSDDNPRIVEYHSVTTLRATDDEVPWCASFVGWCLAQAGYNHTRSAAARSYLTYGLKTDIGIGNIAVLTRTGGGHVAFVVGWDGAYVWLLGGNQSDAVTMARYARERVIDYRMPTDDDKIS